MDVASSRILMKNGSTHNTSQFSGLPLRHQTREASVGVKQVFRSSVASESNLSPLPPLSNSSLAVGEEDFCLRLLLSKRGSLLVFGG